MNSPLPLAIEIEINSDCNMSCAYCPNSNSERVESGHMSEDLFLKILRELNVAEYRGRISYHFYNEPTLSPNLVKFVKLTREYLPEAFIDLFSNGTLLDNNKIEELIAAGVDKFTLTKHIGANIAAVEAAMETMAEHILKKIRLTGYKQIQLTNRGGLVKVKSQHHRAPLSLPCFIPRCALVITLQGNIVPCYEDYLQKNSMGNIQNHSIIEIWNSKKYVAFRERLKTGQRSTIDVCKSCNNAWIIS